MGRYFVEGWPWDRVGFNIRSMKHRLHPGVKMQTGLKLCRLQTFQVHIIAFPLVSADWKQYYLGWSQWISLQLDEIKYYLVTLKITQLSLRKLKLWLASLQLAQWFKWWHDSVKKFTGCIYPQSAVTGFQSPVSNLHFTLTCLETRTQLLDFKSISAKISHKIGHIGNPSGCKVKLWKCFEL